MVIHYAWNGPAEGADRQSVIRDTLWLRTAGDEKALALRSALLNAMIDPLLSFLVHFYPDGEHHDFACVVSTEDRVVSFDFLEPSFFGVQDWTMVVESPSTSPDDKAADVQLLAMVVAARIACWPCPGCQASTLPGEWDDQTACRVCGWSPLRVA